MAGRKGTTEKKAPRKTAKRSSAALAVRAKEIDYSSGDEGGFIAKVVSLGNGSVTDVTPGSKQIGQDPFKVSGSYGENVVEPPISLEQLAFVAEQHPTHAASIEQKVSDIVGMGPTFRPLDPDSTEKPDEIIKWWEGLFDQFTSLETLQAVQDDFETLGWGFLEVVRDVEGVVRELLRIPGHTMRAAPDGHRFLQQRHAKRVWFKRWGVEGDVNAATGNKGPEGSIQQQDLANEVLVFRKPSRRSDWYGIPIYISAIGFITLAVAARDYNILFFENSREARRLITITGLRKEVLDVIDDLERVMRTQLKDPHRHVLLPIIGDANVTVTEMGSIQKDMEFQRLMEQSDAEILTAHRMPPDRLGIVKRGFLGGSVANVTNQIYKDGVVFKGQAMLESRLTRFVQAEFDKASSSTVPWRVDFESLDITDEAADAEVAIELVKANLITLNEGRLKLGMSKHTPFGDMTLSEFLGEALGVQSPAAMLPAAMAGLAGRNGQNEVLDMLRGGMDKIDDTLEQILSLPQPDESALVAAAS